jgi:zearalenone synthase (highly reducing iterative type I polyketide synthase)
LLLPPDHSPRAVSLADELSKSLPDGGLDVNTLAWPPNPQDLEGKLVVSLLEFDRPLLSCLEATDFDTLRDSILSARRVLWVSAGSDPSMEVAVGLLRVLQSENVSKQYQYIQLEDIHGRSILSLSQQIARVVGLETLESEFYERDGRLHIPRWTHEHKMTRALTRSVEMTQFDTIPLGEVRSSLAVRMVHGVDLDNAHFVPDSSHDSRLLADEVEIEIHSIVLNDDDTRSTEGLSLREISGVVRAVGHEVTNLLPQARVCAAFFGHLSSNAVVKKTQCHLLPDSVSMKEAACLPSTFATAFYAVVDVARIKPRQTVFIQAAGTRLGRAVTLLAKASGALVYVTTEGRAETRWLQALGIHSRNIMMEGDPDLVAALRGLTEGHGFDVIVRTKELQESRCRLLKCLAPGGTIVDVQDKAAISDDSLVNTRAEDITIFATSAGRLPCRHSAPRNETVTKALGFSRELSAMCKSSIGFTSDRISDALKCQRKQSGRRNVLVSFDERDRIPVAPSVENRFHLPIEATYVLAGGMGGVGRSLAKFLVANGARNLVFLSRSGTSSSHAKRLVEEMEHKGVKVAVFACDVADSDALASTLAICKETMPPIRGAIQAATVIRDAIFHNLTFQNWQTNLRPKVQGSWNLHEQLPRDMDFFVMLSSIVGLIGHRSQAGYAAGNTYQDALAHYRRLSGLPAVSINLGAMLDVGTIAEGTTTASFSTSEAAQMDEIELQRIASMCISGATYRRTVLPPQVCTGMPSGGMLRAVGQEDPAHFERPFFAVLRNVGISSATSESSTTTTDKVKDLVDQLRLVVSAKDAYRCVSEILRLRLAKELGLAPEAVDLHKPLHQYDIDSLKAVDLRSWFVKVLKADINTFDLLKADNVSALASMIVEVSELVVREHK